MSTKSMFKKISRKTAQAIKTFNMIEEGDRLMVGISGGKDSLLLMHVMTHLQRRAPINFEVIGATIDPGFNEFNPTELKKYAEENNWTYHVAPVDMQPILDQKNHSKNPCSLCSRIRRGQLHKLMDELNCNKLVLGHHLTDICVSLLIGLFRGHGLKTMGPNVLADSGTKRLIRPFAFVPEEWIIEERENYEFPVTGDCDYIEQVEDTGDRAFLAKWVRELEEKFPHIQETMLASMMDVRTDHLLDLKLLQSVIPGLPSNDA